MRLEQMPIKCFFLLHIIIVIFFMSISILFSDYTLDFGVLYVFSSASLHRCTTLSLSLSLSLPFKIVLFSFCSIDSLLFLK